MRTRGAPDLLIPAVQRGIRALDRDVATSAARPMEDAFVSSLAERRFHTLLLEIFGAAAMALALAGIYALTAFGVIERTREIGVRLSLGSTRGRILALIARQALWPPSRSASPPEEPPRSRSAAFSQACSSASPPTTR